MEEDRNNVKQSELKSEENGNSSNLISVMQFLNPKTNQFEDIIPQNYSSEKLTSPIDNPNNVVPRASPNASEVPSNGKLKEVMVVLDGERDYYGRIKPAKISTESGIPYGYYNFIQSDRQGMIYETPSFLTSNQLEKFNEPVYTLIDGKFYKGENGYYILEQKDTYTQMTDFFVEFIGRQIIKEIDGSIIETIKIKLYDNEGWEKNIDIPYEDCINLFTIVEKKFPERLIATDEIPNFKKFQRLTSSIIRYSDVKVKEILAFWGWSQLRENGSRKFYHGGLEDCKSDKSLMPPVTDKSLLATTIRDVLDITKVGSPEVVSTLLVYSAASYMDALFTDAGHFLSHCIMLIGQSGMMKTSLARVIFSPFLPEKDRIQSVRSTEASMHVLHEKAYDDTLVIDDFNREGSVFEVKAKMKNLQTLIRSYSDKSPRAKYGGKDNIKKYAIRGGCVFTGETSMTGELKSGLLRYIKLFLNQRLNGTILKKYQDSPEKIKIFFSEFIRYLEKNYVGYVNRFKNEFEGRRKEYEYLKEPRLIDAFVHLMFAAETMVIFAIDNDAMSYEECSKWYSDFRNGLANILAKQSEESVTIEPYILYVKEVWNLIGTGAIEIAYNLEEYIDNMKKYIGYKDGEIYMFKNESLYKAVSDSFRDKNEYLTMSLQEVAKVLKEHELSECNKGSCLKKASSKLPGRPLMLALIKPKCEKLLEGLNFNV